MKRNWWRWIGPVLFLPALWFADQGRAASRKWDQHVEETEIRRTELVRRVRERVATARAVRDQVSATQFATDLINLQTEQIAFQQTALNRASELYAERDFHDAYFFFFMFLGSAVSLVQSGRSARYWRREYRALRAAQRAPHCDLDPPVGPGPNFALRSRGAEP